MNQKRISVTEKHSAALRIFHWINFPLTALMIWSGVHIYWADQAYIQIPPSLAKALDIEYRLAQGMGWHYFIMWFFALNGLLYFFYVLRSGEWRMLVPQKNSFREPFLVEGKFNGAQRVAYTAVILMGGAALLTGLAIYKPVQAGLVTRLLGGYKAARFEHFLLAVGFILFIIVHIVQVIRAGWNNFRAMVAGYEIEKK